MNYRIGVDIGGTSVKLGVIDENFSVVGMTRIPTGASCESDALVDKIISACREYIKKYTVSAVGIGCAGRIDRENGVVITAGHLPFRNYPVAKRVSEALLLPVSIDNDASCAMIGECAAGACKGCRDSVLVTIGTGIGGAVMIDNKLYRGHNNRAGELGHIVIDMHGDKCECSLSGCFEQYASASALVKLAQSYADNYPESILAQYSASGKYTFAVFEALRDGCEVASAALDEYSKRLCVGLNSIIHIFQPEILVLSGGIAKEGNVLLRLIEPYILQDCPVTVTSLEGNGGLVGAALLGTEYDK